MLKLKTTIITIFSALLLPCISNAFTDPSQHSGFDIPTKAFECHFQSPMNEPKSKMQFVKQWSAFVAKQSLALPYENIDNYLDQLKNCYTNQGWEGYQLALKHSGNLELVRDKRLYSSSHVVGMISVSHEELSEIWETNVPINLIYQNKAQRFNQELIVHLRLREVGSGKFLVDQIIGYPKQRAYPSV